MRRSILIPTVVALACVSSTKAAAWNDFGHMSVAAVAYKHLKPATKKRLAELLKHNPSYAFWITGANAQDRDRVAFMRASTWPDAIKDQPGYKDDAQDAPTANQNIGYADKLQHRYWHYVDQPFSPDGTPTLAAKTPNALTQITAFRAVLSGPSADDDLKSYDLVWLLHLVGDVHQPLHCTTRFDKADPAGDQGGNKVKIAGGSLPAICEDSRCALGPVANLHAFYDGIAGSGYCSHLIESAAQKLPAADATAAAISDEARWVDEGFELAKSAVYAAPIGVGDGPFTIDASYQSAAAKLGRERIALAGVRLANLLNDCVAKETKAKQAAAPSGGHGAGAGGAGH